MKNKSKIVATWEHNGVQYVTTATVINQKESEPVDEFVSVYEYLGNRFAEPGINQKIYKVATRLNVDVDSKEVDTPNYKGRVLLYRRSFLDYFFKNKDSFVDNEPIISSTNIDDDLPF
jgi:hypothetical protein